MVVLVAVDDGCAVAGEGIDDVNSKECGISEVGTFESNWLTSSSSSKSPALECLLVVDLDLSLGLFR